MHRMAADLSRACQDDPRPLLIMYCCWGHPSQRGLAADFVDIEHCYVYTYNPKDGSHTKFQLPEHCSTICLTEDPDTLVTTLIKYAPSPQGISFTF